MVKVVGFELEAGLQRFNRAMSTAIRTASLFDNDMKAIQTTIKGVDKTVDKLDGSKVRVKATADTGAIDRASAKINDLNASPKVTMQKDDSVIDQIGGKVSALNASPKVTMQKDDSAIDRVSGKVSALETSPKVTMQKDDSALTTLEQQISQLNTTATLTLAIDLAGRAKNVFSSTPILGGIQDKQMAENTLQANKTGLDVAEGMAAVSAVWASNWGESRVEIAGVVQQINALAGADEDITDAATAVYELTAGGRDLEEVFRSASVLVTTGVAGSFREASDLIATGFMTAVGTSEDFLDTLSEYAPQLAEIGMSGEQFIAFLNEGVTAGAFNTDKLADSLKEANIRLEESGTMAEGPAFEALTRIGQVDEAEAYLKGETTGAVFIEGLLAAAEEKGTNFDLFEIFGSGMEDLTAGVFGDINWGAIDAAPAVEGAAAEYGSIMTDTLGRDWSTLMRTFEDQFLGVVDTWTGGIDEWVGETRTKIQTLGKELRSGTGLPEALEIALEAPGLADRINDLASGLGHFIIEFVNAIGQMVNIFDQNAGANILEEVARLATGQLGFDIINADNLAEMETAVRQAMARGVDEAGIAAAVETATLELISEDDVARAQEIVTLMSGLQIKRGGEGITLPGMGGVSLIPEDLMNTLMQDVPAIPLDFSAAQAALDQAVIDAEEINTLRTAWETFTALTGDLVVTSDIKTGEQGLGFENLIDFTDETGAIIRFKDQTLLDFNATQAGVSTEVDTMADNTEAAFGDMAFASDRSVAQVNAAADLLLQELQADGPLVVEELGAIQTAYEGVGKAAYDAWVASGGSEGSYPTGIPGRARGGPVSAGQPYIVGERGEELFVPGTDGLILPAGVTSALMSLPSLMGGGGSTVVNNTSIVVNTNINSQGTAQLMGGAGRLARSIRGM